MTTRTDFESRLSVTVRDGVLDLRVRVRARWLLALLAAIAALSNSPVLLQALAQLAS